MDIQQIDEYNVTICSFKTIYSVLGEDMNKKRKWQR